MKGEDVKEILECARSLRASLAVPVMLDHGEALKLIVADLIAKYLYNASRGDEEWTPIFKKVLSYYLSPEELEALTSPASSSAANGVSFTDANEEFAKDCGNHELVVLAHKVREMEAEFTELTSEVTALLTIIESDENEIGVVTSMAINGMRKILTTSRYESKTDTIEHHYDRA